MNTNRQWLLAQRPQGMVGKDNFTYAEQPIPEPGDGQVLVRNLYLSFDPTQRGWMEDRESYLPPVALGEPMRAGSIGQVVESHHAEFAVGDIVQTTGGWQDFVVAAPGQGPMGLSKVPDGVTPEMMLSVLGITGLTAYFGLLDLGQPQASETVLVSGAAGATGSIAGQIARIRGVGLWALQEVQKSALGSKMKPVLMTSSIIKTKTLTRVSHRLARIN